jgi:hypothetical protein
VSFTGLVTIVIATALPPAAPSEGSIRAFLPEVPVWSQCAGREVARPITGECVDYDDATPFLDPERGVYRAALDRRNWLEVRDGTLELLAVHVIDNGEGKGWPHGPQGNLLFDFFRPDEPRLVSRDDADQRRVASPRVLRGPHRTHGNTDEWLDDELVAYRDAGLFRWGSAPGTDDAVVMRIFETDSDSEDGFLGRRNDVLGMSLIDRAATEGPDGTWVTFHHFTNGHPRRAEPGVTIRALVRTRRGAASRWRHANGSKGAAPRLASRVARLEASCASDPDAPSSLCAPYEAPLEAPPPSTPRAKVRAPPLFPAALIRSAAELERWITGLPELPGLSS